jgi:Flp pilus assembly protein TadD
MALAFISLIRQEAGNACLANNVGVHLLLKGRTSDARFHFALAIENVNTSGKAGAQIPQLPLGEDSSPWGR